MKYIPSVSRPFALAAAVLLVLGGLSKSGGAQTVPPAWNSMATYALGDLVEAYGNIYRCTHAVSTPNVNPSKAYTNWELYFVRTNTTLLIGKGQTFPSLATVWSYCMNSHIAQSAYLHLSIDTAQGDFTEAFSVPFSLDHPFGANISIIGDHENNIAISFYNSNGLTLDGGHSFGSISGLQLISTPDLNDVYNGVVINGGTLSGLSSVGIQGFNVPVLAEYGARVTMSDETIPQTSPDNSPTYGVDATYGSVVNMEGCTVSGCLVGIEVRNGAILDITGGTISSNFTGIETQVNGQADASNATFTGNSTFDMSALTAGIVEVNGASYDHSKTNTANGGAIFTTGP